MKVILLKDVAKLGKKYDVKNVSDGHALNFLIPRGMAQVASDSLLRKVEGEKAAIAEARKKHAAVLLSALKAIKGGKVEISAKANEKGSLFSAVHVKEIGDALSKSGVDMSLLGAESILLDKPIKEAGEHAFEVAVGADKVKLVAVVKAE